MKITAILKPKLEIQCDITQYIVLLWWMEESHYQDLMIYMLINGPVWSIAQNQTSWTLLTCLGFWKRRHLHQTIRSQHNLRQFCPCADLIRWSLWRYQYLWFLHCEPWTGVEQRGKAARGLLTSQKRCLSKHKYKQLDRGLVAQQTVGNKRICVPAWDSSLFYLSDSGAASKGNPCLKKWPSLFFSS